jgi:hypothetical protein
MSLNTPTYPDDDRYDQFKEIIEALSGAGEWERARDGLLKLSKSRDSSDMKQRASQAFREMDKDGSGVLSVRI